MKYIVVGDTSTNLANRARKIDPRAILLTEQNIESFNSQSGTFYTSLGDFKNIEKFIEVLKASDFIEYLPCEDADLDRETRGHLLLLNIATNRTIKGLEVDHDHLTFGREFDIIDRKSDQPQIWNVGCSITSGVGVRPEQTYGAKISQHLKMPWCNLGREGSSIAWAGNQILSSDIRSNDIVIWGVTSRYRYTYWADQDHVYHVVPTTHIQHPLINEVIGELWLPSAHVAYLGLKSISMVANFCQKVGARLYFLGMFPDALVYKHLERYGRLIPCPRYQDWIDLGADNFHPGPRQHLDFAERFLKFYEQG